MAVVSPAAARKKQPPPAPAAPAPPVVTVGAGVEKWRAGDYAGAVAVWQPFANAGDADAMFNIGQAYKLGRSVPKDEAQARDWYRKAAMKGHRPAQANLGIMLFQAGEKLEAVRWLKAAADQNEMRAQYVLGVAYWNGDGAPRSLMLAYAYLSRAAQLGLPEASNALGTLETRLTAADRANGTAVATSLAAGDGVPALFAGPNPIPPPFGLAASGSAGTPQPRPLTNTPVMAAAVPATETPKPVLLTQREAPPVPEMRAAPPPRVTAPPLPAPAVVAALTSQWSPSRPSPTPPALMPATAAPGSAATPPGPVVRPPIRPAAPVVTAVAIPPAVVRQPAPLPTEPKPMAVVAPPVAKLVVEKAKAMVAAEKSAPIRVTAWRVQLGAFSKRTLAEAAWKKVQAKQGKVMAAVKPVYDESANITKLQLGPYASEKLARDACAKIAFAGSACFVTKG